MNEPINDMFGFLNDPEHSLDIPSYDQIVEHIEEADKALEEDDEAILYEAMVILGGDISKFLEYPELLQEQKWKQIFDAVNDRSEWILIALKQFDGESWYSE